MKTIFKILAVVVFMIFLIAQPANAGGWIIYHDNQYKGKVVDEETNQPIEGAAVVAIWYVQQSAWPAGPIAKFLNAKEAITDKNGDFVIPAMFGFNLWPGFLDEPEVVVFKPGYRSYKEYNYRQHERVVIQLSKATTKKERMETVSSLDVCRTMTDKKCAKKIPYMLNLRGKERKDLELK